MIFSSRMWILGGLGLIYGALWELEPGRRPHETAGLGAAQGPTAGDGHGSAGSSSWRAAWAVSVLFLALLKLQIGFEAPFRAGFWAHSCPLEG